MHKKTIFPSKGWTDMYSKQPAPSHGPPCSGNSASIFPPCDRLPVPLPPKSAYGGIELAGRYLRYPIKRRHIFLFCSAGRVFAICFHRTVLWKALHPLYRSLFSPLYHCNKYIEVCQCIVVIKEGRRKTSPRRARRGLLPFSFIPFHSPEGVSALSYQNQRLFFEFC